MFDHVMFDELLKVKLPLPDDLLKVTPLRVTSEVARAAAESKNVPVVTTSLAFPVASWMVCHAIVAAFA